MSKLYDLKNWLSLKESAIHLSRFFGEDVCEADILRLALDGQLTLSVHIVNSIQVRQWRGLAKEHEDLDGYGYLICKDQGDNRFRRALDLEDDELLAIWQKPISLGGFLDLPLLGSEKTDIENRYHQLTDGPRVISNQEDEGTFLITSAGGRMELYEILTDTPSDELRETFKIDEYWSYEPNQFPVDKLPPNCVLVITKQELTYFEEENSSSKPSSELSSQAQLSKGCNKKEILSAAWPMPIGMTLEPFLSDVPVWLKPARTMRGTPGRGSSLWNPAQIAVCMVSPSKGRQWNGNRKSLHSFIRREFPEYLAEWEAASEHL